MFLELHPENPEPRKMAQVVECLRDGGLVIYPTDSVYGLGCDIGNHKAMERICRFKGIKPEKANFSFICHDLSHISQYTRPLSNRVYKAMRKHLPGPFTFILRASSEVPKLLKNKKKTVGIRVPASRIALEMIEMLGNPILSTSIKNIDDPIVEYPTDPYEIYEEFGKQVDIVIDGGAGNANPSTVIDCSGGDEEFEIIRQGVGVFEL